MEETRRRVQQEQLGHRGRKHDPLYRIRNTLRAGADKLTARQIERIEAGLQAGDPHFDPTWAKLVRALVDGGQCVADVFGQGCSAVRMWLPVLILMVR
jgi:hypothetical protein